jgi:hypothetical protein
MATRKKWRKKKRSQDVRLKPGPGRIYLVGDPDQTVFGLKDDLSIEVHDLSIEVLRELTPEDLLVIDERSVRLLNGLAQVIDLVLEPKKAESVIGDLTEQYAGRLAKTRNAGSSRRSSGSSTAAPWTSSVAS